MTPEQQAAEMPDADLEERLDAANDAGTGKAAPSSAADLRSIGRMWREVFSDAAVLGRAEFILARREVGENVKGYGKSVVLFISGFAFLLLAGIFFTVGAVVALAKLIGFLWALLAVGAGCVIIGIILAIAGRSSARGLSLMPEKTLDRLSSDVDHLTMRMDEKMKAVQE